MPIDSRPSGPGPAEGVGAATDAESGAQAEARLLCETARGNEAAFRVLVARHLRALLAIGRRMLGETAEAEDMAQEALLRLWRGAGQIEVGPAGLRPWLNRVAANLCLDRLRARKVAPQLREELPEPAVAASQLRGLEEAELARRVDRALRQLPERQRLAVVLFHYQGLTQGEAAATLEVSEDALESLLARARRSLKTALADEWKGLLPETLEQAGSIALRTGDGHGD